MSKLLVGLIGAGIQRSLTPAMHEEEAHAQGLALHYQLIDLDAAGVGADKLPTLIEAARIMGFAGLNITYPCKQAVMPLLDELSDEAQAMGAVNTVVFRDGRAIGHNTDGSGWAWGFQRALPQARLEPRGAARRRRRRLGHRACGAAPGRGASGDRRPRGRPCRRGGGGLERTLRCCAGQRRHRRGRRAAGRHRADPRHAHRHGQAAGPAAAGRTAAARAVGGRDRLLPARHRAAARRARQGLRHGRRRHDGRGPGDRRLRTLHRPARPTRRGCRRISAACWRSATRPDPQGDAMPPTVDREAIAELPNPLGLDGIEFIEYATSRPQALGQVLEMHGLPAGGAASLARGAAVPAGRDEHRHQRPRRRAAARRGAGRDAGDRRGGACACATPRAAYRACAGARRLGRADAGGGDGAAHPGDPRRRAPAASTSSTAADEFSIYDVDFVPIPTVDQHPPAIAGLHWFGMVQYIGNDRMDDWCEFYRELFGFERLPDDAALRHPAQGPHPAQPLRQLLPAADRARARPASTSRAKSRCSASAWARPTCRRRWRRCARAAWTSSRPASCTPTRAARSPRR